MLETADAVNDDSSNGQTGSRAENGMGIGVYEFSVGGIDVIGTVTIDTVVTTNII
jgi:hypothetical protein